MMPSISTLAIASAGLATLAHAGYDPTLVGTWTTKSRAVLTGPGFYNPVTDTLIEPSLTGVSYSFTIDGYYEEAYYRAISNPTTPSCPSGIMQWQHGVYSLPGNGSIILEPFGVDGRQLLSSPCSYDESVYTRYEQPELFLTYSVIMDPYHNIQRLNLAKFDGSPMLPMYLVYSPPQMLPTETLNPLPTATAKSRVKRNLQERSKEDQIHMAKKAKNVIQKPPSQLLNADRWWWLGVGLMGLGTVMYMLPTSS